jgi:molecular chaperone HscB
MQPHHPTTPPPHHPTHFDRLGLPRRFLVDPAELERAYLERSREVHPDYHLGGSDADLAASLEASAGVNEAYNTLRDPFARAEYLLTLEGGPSASQQKQMPPAFLAEMLDAREQIELAKGKPDAIARLEADFQGRFDGLMSEVAAAFAMPSRDVALHGKIRGLLNAAKYVRGLLRDLHSD